MVIAAVCQPAGGQAAEDRVARGVLIEMERLGIELGGKGLDSLLVDRQRTGAKDLADGKVFEIFGRSARRSPP